MKRKCNRNKTKETMWNTFKKSKEKQIENNESVIAKEELKLMRAKADEEAVKIYTKIYCLFKEHLNELYTSFNERSENELKKGDNFILLKENPAELDDELLNDSIYYNTVEFYNSIPELLVEFDLPKYYIFTIKITHDDIIEIYHVRFRVNPSIKQINNGNAICVTVIGVDKTIYKLI